MTTSNISPNGNARMRVLIGKAAETLTQLADHVSCPDKKARFKAKAQDIRRRAQELGDV